jgi:steroid Delta-isomerase
MTAEDLHPAVRANMSSIEYAMAKDKQAWLALYRDDAILRDPVGVSPLDPSGQGHVGKAAIEAFWDKVIAPVRITMIPGLRCPSGAFACAVPMRAETDLGNGRKTMVDMIAVYEVDEEGLIVRMSAYWDWNALQAQLRG